MAKYPHEAGHSDSRFPNAKIDGDEVTGMNGDEELNGWARVGGSEVTYKRSNAKDEKVVFMEYK